MKLIFDSGIDEYRQSQNEASQTKTYEENGQLFKIHVSSYKVGEYQIYRFSEAGAWEIVEGRGGSFEGKISISFSDTQYLNHEIKKANWSKIWEDLEKQVKVYAKILPEVKKE